MRGHIEIYIDGYRPKRRDIAHLYFDPKTGIVTGGIDAEAPPHIFELGSDEWWEEGWAAGDNKSNVPCLRDCGSRLKQFTSFEEATAFVAARQKKHNDHQHVLVYVIEDAKGFEDKVIINSPDDIKELDAIVEQQQMKRKLRNKRS